VPHVTLPISPLGPTLPIVVGVSQPRQQTLAAAGQAVPASVVAQVLIDTGASCSCIDAGILTALGIPPSGSVLVRTPSTSQAPHTAIQFDVSLTLTRT
jgi:hypothetical protein